MTKATHQAVDVAAAKPAELSALLGKFDAAAANLDGSTARLDAWAAHEYCVAAGFVKRGAPSQMARELCEYFAPEKPEAPTSNPAVALRAIPDVDENDEGKTAAEFNQWRGQCKGRLSAVAGDLKRLNRGGFVSAVELQTLSSTLAAILDRLDAPEKTAADPVSGQQSETTMLGAALLSLTRAIGYGHGKGQGDSYSALSAAKLVRGIMAIYGFTVGVKRLQNLNSDARK